MPAKIIHTAVIDGKLTRTISYNKPEWLQILLKRIGA